MKIEMRCARCGFPVKGTMQVDEQGEPVAKVEPCDPCAGRQDSEGWSRGWDAAMMEFKAKSREVKP